MSYNEIKRHGRDDFPFGLYRVDENHPKYYMTLHWHTQVEIIRVSSGELDLSLDGTTHVLRAGDVAFVNSETLHGATPSDCVYECLVFQSEFLKTGNRDADAFIDCVSSRGVTIKEIIDDPEEKKLVERIMSEAADESDGYAFRVVGACQTFFGEIIKKGHFCYREYHVPEKNCKLKRALKFMRDNYAEEITLDDVASQAEFSTKYFCSFFKRETGVTPVEYLTSYRIERAAKKLITTDSSVTRIAFDCGFNDLSYFTKTFKRLKGVTPKNYRDENTVARPND